MESKSDRAIMAEPEWLTQLDLAEIVTPGSVVRIEDVEDEGP
ncbi:hypothetical protein [Streptomyces sp. PR69]|nr:hypothetical protein [Streptomyces sp. PR69]